MKKISTISGSVRRCATAASTALTAALTALLLVACASDDATVPAAAPAEGDAIALTTTVGGTTTRATATTSGLTSNETQIASGQAIDLYIGSSVPTSGGSYSANTRISATAGNPDGNRVLNLGATYYWPASGNLSFYAFWPAGLFSTTSRTSATKSITVPADQGGTDAPTLTGGTTSADILYAEAVNVSSAASPVPLTFHHQMAKVTVTLLPGDGVTATQLQSATVTLANVQRNGTLTAATGAVTATGERSNITVKTSGNTSLTNYCLLPPQTLNDTQVSVSVTTAGMSNTLTYALPGETLPAAQNLRLTLTVSQTELTLQTLAVTAWQLNDYQPESVRYNDYIHQPLTITNTYDGTNTVTFRNQAITNNVTMKRYSAAGILQQTATAAKNGGSGSVNLAKGEYVTFTATNAAYATGTGSGQYSNITCSQTCTVSGNIMSLISADGYATATTLSSNYTFTYLFNNNTGITDASRLVLPATTLSAYCYFRMFQSCSYLVTPPAVLPAMTTTDYCYCAMFQGCSRLATAPVLPATTLASSCYYSMFYFCTSLTKTPVLPALTLATDCYCYMFYNCSSLTEVYCYATTGINTNGSTTAWLSNTATSGTRTFHKNPSATWPTNSVNGIPSGWTVQNY